MITEHQREILKWHSAAIAQAESKRRWSSLAVFFACLWFGTFVAYLREAL